MVAIYNRKPIGEILLCSLCGDKKGYGFIDEETPDATMALRPEYCKKGKGRKLIYWQLDGTDSRNSSVFLFVSKESLQKEFMTIRIRSLQ